MLSQHLETLETLMTKVATGKRAPKDMNLFLLNVAECLSECARAARHMESPPPDIDDDPFEELQMEFRAEEGARA